MKRYVYVLCLAISLLGLSSCSKNDPAPVSPAVGRWQLNRGLLNGFPASADLNGYSLDLYQIIGVAATIDVFSDNTFNLNYKRNFVDDETGTWTLANNTLTLNYDTGGSENYTYSKNKNVEEITAVTSSTFAVPLSSTLTVNGTVTPVYRK